MTLMVNLLGGPGSGKSTTAAGVFYLLKTRGVNCEYIQEYAKDKTWAGEEFVLGCQPYITAKQLFRQHRLIGKVDVAITDAPLINGLVYPGAYVDGFFEEWLLNTFSKFDNLNIFLRRNLSNHPYNTAGRSQTLDESQQIDGKIWGILKSERINFTELEVANTNAEEIANMILEVLEFKRANPS